MQTEYFQGKDGYIWWNGVVEDRKDPLMIGRCRVRILGWHTPNKSELPTADLPWAQVVMPITSASQTGVGYTPVGPVEGTWVMGFYRDGELAQEPVMVGTLPGVPEKFAKINTGFNDPRLDTDDTDLNSISSTTGVGQKGTPTNLTSFPFPPKSISIVTGGEAEISSYTDKERKAFTSQSLYPRELNVPTTSKYARGEGDSSSLATTDGIIAFKNKNLSSRTIVSIFSPSTFLIPKGESIIAFAGKSIEGTKDYLSSDDYASLKSIGEVKQIKQPPSAYAAVYPYNHVYESESGHLIEMDDTPGKERLHWYHRSGTFTEFHPKGIRVDKTNAHRYNMVSGNQETIIGGQEIKSISSDSTTKIGGKLTLNSGKEIRMISDTGNVVIDSSTLNTYVGGKHVILDAKDTLILRGGTQIIRDTPFLKDAMGKYDMSVSGGYTLSAGKISLSSGLGAINITSGGPIQQIIGGTSEEIISNVGVALGNVNGKLIKTLLGKMVLETVDPTTGGIDLNVGPFGTASWIQQSLGDISIESVLGTTGVTIAAVQTATLKGLVKALVESPVMTQIISDAIVEIEAPAIQVGGKSEPALLGKAFTDLFKEHGHDSPNGPTGKVSKQFAMKIIKTMSKKVFIG